MAIQVLAAPVTRVPVAASIPVQVAARIPVPVAVLMLAPGGLATVGRAAGTLTGGTGRLHIANEPLNLLEKPALNVGPGGLGAGRH